MSRVTGRVEVLLNGDLLLNKEGAKAGGIGISGEPPFELSGVYGDTGLHGYVEKPIEAYCEVTVTDRDDIMLSSIAQIRENGTIIFRSARGGKVYTLNEATCMRNISVTGGEGETPLRFTGRAWTEGTDPAL